MNDKQEWCWCNPCALVWVVFGAMVASRIWLSVDWTYLIVAGVVLLPAIAVFAREEREDIHDAAQDLVADIWYLFKGWKRPASQAPSPAPQKD